VALYQLGSPGTHGVSGLASIRLPTNNPVGGVQFILDIGLSLGVRVHLSHVMELLAEAAVLVSGDMPEVVASVLPLQSAVSQIELFIAAPQRDGQNQTRDNSMPQRMDSDLSGIPLREWAKCGLRLQRWTVHWSARVIGSWLSIGSTSSLSRRAISTRVWRWTRCATHSGYQKPVPDSGGRPPF